MSTSSELPVVVLLVRIGDWDEPQATEAEIIQSLQDAGYTALVTRDPASCLALLDDLPEPAVVLADWQAFGIYHKEDFSNGLLYNPFWEWRFAIETKRASGRITGLIAVYHKAAIMTLDWFGAPRAVSCDMILDYPFSSKVLSRWLQRLIENPQTEVFDIWDDRRKIEG